MGSYRVKKGGKGAKGFPSPKRNNLGDSYVQWLSGGDKGKNKIKRGIGFGGDGGVD